MAEFIPSSLNQVNATSGEKKVFKFLEHLFSDDDQVCIWYEPEALGRYSDFLIWHPAWGLLAVEVKDWSKSHFKQLDKLNRTGFVGEFFI
ncbi:NERD domain-containing protein [uncultured Acinetobacter sp.]|uniref:NERD domain-containing protein n=1 Tax=uncultured Acinetobacter sp. TaxID=165433 RepID=UPI00260FCE62|nr:NERD domain-containing protein [uncultured Acinetobacter sp.]